MNRRIVLVVASMGLLGCSLLSRVTGGNEESEAEVETPAMTAAAPPLDASAAGDAACLVGTWNVTEIEGYVQSILPAQVDRSSLEYQGMSGTMQVTFESDGTGSYLLQDFVVSYNMMGLPMAFGLNGNGTLTYQTAGDRVTIQTGDDSTLTGQLSLGTTSSPLGDLGESAISGTQAYACQGDTLEMTPDSENASPVVYQREAP